MITFQYEDNSTTVTVTTEGSYIHDVKEDFRKFLLAVGFHPDNVKEVLGDAP